MFWNHSIEGQNVTFNGVPFIVSTTRKQHCQFGKLYFKERTASSGRTRLQGTRKIGCPAHVHVHELTLFPSFAVSEACTLGSRKLKETKARKINELKESLAAGKKVDTETKYFVLLPTKEAHGSYHPTSGPAGFAQRVHPKIIEKINVLVGEGITEVEEVKRALRHYVLHILFPDPNNRPDETNRAYYPTKTDIKNHVYSAKRAQELSKLDQDNLSLKIEQWKGENPTTRFHYRPYKEIKQEYSDCTFVKADDQQAAFSQTLLYVHQEQWQQQLLRRYGNTIVLIDATYKTTKYELPIFFVTVKTNVGYTPIAEFVVQSETGDKIAEALKVLASWNPEWNPPYFMTDYSDAEISAIESVFPQCKVYLCDFHREQSGSGGSRIRSMGSHLQMEKSSLDSSAPALGHHQDQMVHQLVVTSSRQ